MPPDAILARPMIAKVYRAVDVCDIAKVQPYVLRSWEKEFPGIGRQKSADSPRLYRQSDLDQVLRIKELVFTEGLTLSGARRRLEESGLRPATSEEEVAEVLDALASDARTRIAYVKDGLRSILRMLGSAPGTVVVVGEPRSRAQKKQSSASVRARSGRSKAVVTKLSQRRKAATRRMGAANRKRSNKQRRGRAHA